jgi:hypothetical protein
MDALTTHGLQWFHRPLQFFIQISVFFPSFYGCNENPWHGSQLCRSRCGNPAFSCNNDGSPVLIQLPEEIRDDCRGERAISREINKLLTKN